MRQYADSVTSGFAPCDPAVGYSSPIARFSQVASRTPAPPLEGTAVSTTPSSDVRPEGARL
jgi:hypothetical protein